MVPFVRIGLVAVVPAALMALGGVSAGKPDLHSNAKLWDPQAAAAYLDSRTKAWSGGGAMDRGTFCISCHTALPYAIARPAMRTELGESQTSSVERLLLDSVTKRVDDWDAIQPYLGDKNGGPGTESVLNALILAQQDSRVGHLSDTTRKALKIMWARQSKTGDRAGAWPWISAGNEPWEAPDSEYWGATLGAVAAGTAPDRYQSMPQIQDDLRLLKAYLRREEPGKSLLNRLGLLWACTKMPGLITADRRAAIISDALALQQPDGGWSTVSLIPASWPRRDRTPKVTKSDGYGTGMVAFVLEQAGVRRARPEMRKALAWLSQNQDRSTGAWLTASPNIARDASTDVGKFMTDAATAYAVLALSAQTQ